MFEISTSPCRICPTPVTVTVRARYDHALVHGTLCLVVDGAEYHSSCWFADEDTRPLTVQRFLLEHRGEYSIWMQGDKQVTPVVTVELD